MHVNYFVSVKKPDSDSIHIHNLILTVLKSTASYYQLSTCHSSCTIVQPCPQTANNRNEKSTNYTTYKHSAVNIQPCNEAIHTQQENDCFLPSQDPHTFLALCDLHPEPMNLIYKLKILVIISQKLSHERLMTAKLCIMLLRGWLTVFCSNRITRLFNCSIHGVTAHKPQ